VCKYKRSVCKYIPSMNSRVEWREDDIYDDDDDDARDNLFRGLVSFFYLSVTLVCLFL
jgi:hypothetical protein